MNEEETLDKISEHIESSNAVLFGAAGEPEEALGYMDKAQELVKQLSGTTETFMSEFIRAFRNFVLGYLSLGREGDLEVALGYFTEARKIVRTLKEEHPKNTDNVKFRDFELGIEAKILETQIAKSEGQEKDELKAKLAFIREKLYKNLPPESPIRLFIEWIQSFNKAMLSFRESGTALLKLNLEDATHYIAEANNQLRPYQQSTHSYESLPFALQSFTDLLRGFGQLLAARQSYINTLHEAVIGDVSERHVTELKEADRQLREGMELIEKKVPVLNKQMGAIIGEFPLEAMRNSIDFQRDVTNNLRRLVKESLSPKAITRRTSPRFLIYFVLTFIIVLFGSRWSGLVGEVGGGQVINILLISLLVSVIASFGYEVGLKYVTALRIRFGSDQRSPEGSQANMAG